MPTATPIVSIIVPVYNGAATLSDCLGSIETAVHALPHGDRDRVEVIICDNHSTDESLEMVESREFPCPARIVQPPAHLENRTENWAYGLAQCRGEWMEMLHADDALANGALMTWLEAVRSPLAGGVGIITARHATFNDCPGDGGSSRPRFPAASIVSGRALARWVLPLICPFVPFVMIRREVFERVGGLDSRFQLAQDWDLWRRMCAAADVLYWPVVVGEWRQHPTNAAYQRLNMREHLEMTAQLRHFRGLAVPRAVRVLAARGTAVRTLRTLANDQSTEAESIRKEIPVHPAFLHGWRELQMMFGSVILNLLRVVGAARSRSRL
jgi:glycosyltransferase involved in cell wall biosynthesis